MNRTSPLTGVALGALLVMLPKAAFAQDPTPAAPTTTPTTEPPPPIAPPSSSSSSSTTTTPSTTPPPASPVVPGSEPGQPGGPGTSGPAGAAATTAETRQRLLVPRYGEDYYPAMAPEDGLLRAASIDDKRGIKFAFHGYFRAPMRITKAERESPKPGEGNWNYRTPYLVDDDYYHSGFAYTPVNETDFTELYLSVGNDRLTATLGLQATLFSDAAQPAVDSQLGIAQGWLTYRIPLEFVPYFKTKMRVKAGAFWERFGHMPKYDTYIFARIHQMGENIRFEAEHDKLTLWAEHGVGTHLEDIASNQGLTLLNYATVGASYDRTIELGGYIFDSQSRDKRPLKDLTDSQISIYGVDVRADTHYAGKLYAATSYIAATQSEWQSPAIEVMHSYGGRGLEENYFGTQSSQNGTGSLWNVGWQWDLSLADLYKEYAGAHSSPLPWGGDVMTSFFGLYSFIQSKQQSTDPLINKDDRKSFKYGVEPAWRITDWVGISGRYDRVVLDISDSANSFRILSPRISFFTSFLTREMIYIQYSRYVYNERIRLRTGQVQLENFPDDHVLKIQAQMSF